jgi:hypothetical protein
MPQLQLIITVDSATGNTSVSGPIDNQLLCYGMLQVARDAILERKQKQAESRIIQPEPGLIVG